MFQQSLVGDVLREGRQTAAPPGITLVLMTSGQCAIRGANRRMMEEIMYGDALTATVTTKLPLPSFPGKLHTFYPSTITSFSPFYPNTLS
eukprot:6587161-Heterocapsa_arctica.AAC.1